VWTLPADPLHVDVELEESAAATATIDATGGAVSAVGHDGTRYRVTIPAQKIWQATSITVTPIARLSAEGKEAGPGVVFGVQLEPSGLTLFPDASLTIEPKTSLDDQAVVYFGYQGDGDDAGLEVADQRERGHVLPISHFSGAGIVRRTSPTGGADDESGMYEILFERMASQMAADRLARVVARELAQERERALRGEDPQPGGGIALTAEWQQSYLSRVIEPLIAVAAHPAATCDQAAEAAAALMGAARQRALLGVGDDNEASAAVISAYQAAAERLEPLLEAACRRDAARACRETGDLIDVVRRGYVEVRAKSLLGAATDAQLDAVIEAYRAILRWCGVYELTWTSTGQIKNRRYTIDSVIDGHMTLRYEDPESGDLGDIRLKGATTSGLNPFLTSVGCHSFQNRLVCPPGADRQAPTTGDVTELQLRVVSTTQVGGQPIIRTQGEDRLVLEFKPSAMVLEASVRTEAGNVPLPLEIYLAAYTVAHKPDLIGIAVRITEWEHVGHPLMFRKTYTGSRQKDDSTFSDSTTFEFTHTPDPAT
jgi:hypothetical protein